MRHADPVSYFSAMKLALYWSLILASCTLASGETGWKAGVAKTPITPAEPIWMAGFASRTKPSEGVRQDIYVRALAIDDGGGKPAVVVTLDLAGIDRQSADEIARQCQARYGLSRDRMILNVSHTHSGPVAGIVPMPLYDLTAAQRDVVDRYTVQLIEKSVGVVGTAISTMAPASLYFDQGLAGIGVNRRRVGNRSLPGPVDPDVPVLAVRDQAGTLLALVMGYACHATTLNDYLISNDWPGYAQAAIEKAHPGATAIFIQGCGADSNALPRAGEELCRKRGEILAAAVEQVLSGKMKPLASPLRTAFTRTDLPLVNPSTREELEKKLQDKLPAYRTTARHLLDVLDRDGKFPDRYPYPVQVWQFGSGLKLIALGGETVADYALRLKGIHGFDDTWVAGYSNDVMAYIPSLRVLREGGYEGRESMVYFGRAGQFGEEVEEIIVAAVAELVKQTGRSATP